MAIRSLALVLLVFFSFAAIAEEEGGETAVVEYSPGEKEYREKSQKLNSLESKIGELEATFQALVKANSETTDKNKRLDLVEKMKAVKQEHDETVDKYTDLRDEVRFKFPDKGKTIMRRYAPMQKKSMQQLEKRSTLDGDLTKAKKAAEKAYRPFIRKAEEEERKKILEQEKAKKASASNPDDPKNKIPKIRLEK